MANFNIYASFLFYLSIACIITTISLILYRKVAKDKNTILLSILFIVIFYFISILMPMYLVSIGFQPIRTSNLNMWQKNGILVLGLIVWAAPVIYIVQKEKKKAGSDGGGPRK